MLAALMSPQSSRDMQQVPRRFPWRSPNVNIRCRVLNTIAVFVVVCCFSLAFVAAGELPETKHWARRSILDATGTAALAEIPDSDKRPFRIAVYYRFRDGEDQDVMDYIQDFVIPTMQSLTARWLRV